jgi:hypothetical protein
VQLTDIYGLTVAVGHKVEQIEDQVQDVKCSVDELKAMMAHGARNACIVSSLEMPVPPAIFFGRDTVINKIAEHLVSGERARSRVCILAPGGMGKTSTALAVMKHPSIMGKFAEQHRFWVPCISANSPSTFLVHLAKHLRIARDTGDPLNDILSSLNATEGPQVILLDNFETPWHPVEGNQETVKDILRALDSLPHVAILVTMRSEFPPLDEWISEPLSHVELQDSRRIYTAIDARAGGDPELDNLLQALGHLPYAVTLMATLGKRSLSTTQRLLGRWNEKGTNMLSKAQGGMDHSIELSIQFVADSRDAITLLQVLSMLPAGIGHSHLDLWIPSWTPEAMDALRDAALVLVNQSKTESLGAEESHLFVLPVVQSYMHQHDRIPNDIRKGVYAACCRFLNTHRAPVKGPNDRNFKRDLAAIAAQAINIQVLLTKIIQDAIGLEGGHSSPFPPSQEPNSSLPLKPAIQPEQLDALLTFSWFQRWTKPRFEILEHILTLARNADDSPRMADALICLGAVSWLRGRRQEARSCFSEAGDLFAALGDDLRHFRSEMESLECLHGLGTNSLPALLQSESRWKDRPCNADISFGAFLHWKATSL